MHDPEGSQIQDASDLHSVDAIQDAVAGETAAAIDQAQSRHPSLGRGFEGRDSISEVRRDQGYTGEIPRPDTSHIVETKVDYEPDPGEPAPVSEAAKVVKFRRRPTGSTSPSQTKSKKTDLTERERQVGLQGVRAARAILAEQAASHETKPAHKPNISPRWFGPK